MTINKSQSQTLYVVGLDLRNPAFTHGQHYVTMSSVTNVSNLAVLYKGITSLSLLRMGPSGEWPVWATLRQVRIGRCVCEVVLQLILKRKYRNETEKRNGKQVQEGWRVNRLLRKERRKQN